MFRNVRQFEDRGSSSRHTFEPSPTYITVERDLRSICAQWQQHWNERLSDHEAGEAETATVLFRIETIGQLVNHLLETRRSRIAAATREKEIHYARHWVTELGKDTTLRSLTSDVLVEAQARMAMRLKAGTVNCCRGLLKTYLRWAIEHGYMDHSPHRDLPKLHDPRTLDSKEWWNAEEVGFALRCAELDEHQPTAVLLVAMGCMLGLRYEEIIMVRWTDLDLDARHPASGELRPTCRIVPHDGWKPKDGEARTIPIHSRLLEILLARRRPDGYLLTAEPTTAAARVRKEGGKRVYRYDPRAVWRRIIKCIVSAGGKEISPNGMRHSFASNLLIAGESDVKVARYLGHADTKMVHKHYGHLLAYDSGINRVSYG
jgi:integrase